MDEPLVRTEIERAALRAAGREPSRNVPAGPSISEDEAIRARRRAEEARIRAERAALKAALSLERSARLHQRIARLFAVEDDESETRPFTADS